MNSKTKARKWRELKDLQRLLNDSLAEQTQWTPLSSAKGTGMHEFVKLDANRAEFRITWFGKAFALIFLVAGLAVVIGGAVKWDWRMVLAGTLFAAVGAGLYYFLKRPIVFDKRIGHFWKGRGQPETASAKPGNVVKLEAVHALQLLHEVVRVESVDSDTQQPTGRCRDHYELNLVLADGQRVHVVSYSDAEFLRDDARKLAEFLGVPVWDYA